MLRYNFSVFVFLFVMLILLKYNSYREYEKDLKAALFTKEQWDDKYLYRLEMYYDLIDTHLQQGIQITKVKRLLGYTDFRRVYEDKICISYYLGQSDALFTHTSFDLVICPDKAGEIVESIKLIGGHHGYFDKGKSAMIDNYGNLRLLPDNE